MVPERHHLPNCKQASLLTKTSWDSGWSTSTGRVTGRVSSQKRHTAHLRSCAGCTPRKQSSRDGGGDKSQPSTGGDHARQAPGHLSCSDLGSAQNAGPTQSAPLWSTREPEPERLRPGKCTQPRQYRLGKHTRPERGQTQCGRDTASIARDTCWQCSSLPTARLNK